MERSSVFHYAGVASRSIVTVAPRPRNHLFRETVAEMVERTALGIAWRLKRDGLAGAVAIARMHLDARRLPARDLPPAQAALARPEGLVGIAQDLSVPTLLRAYARGLYPMAHVLAPKWWSPAERCVLLYDDFHMSRRLRSHIKQARYRVTFDSSFDRVIKACAGRREGKWHLTWITPQIMRAYADLHDAGYAHSFEVWNADGELVGGGYGVAIGRCFVVESQFCLEDNTSKIGFAFLNWHLARWGFRLTDNKRPSSAVSRMGFRTIPRCEYLRHLHEGLAPRIKPGHWAVQADAATIAAWRPGKTPGVT